MLKINVKKSNCLRIGARRDAVCSNIQTLDGREIVWVDVIPVSYTHLTLPTTYACRSRWSPYH